MLVRAVPIRLRTNGQNRDTDTHWISCCEGCCYWVFPLNAEQHLFCFFDVSFFLFKQLNVWYMKKNELARRSRSSGWYWVITCFLLHLLRKCSNASCLKETNERDTDTNANNAENATLAFNRFYAKYFAILLLKRRSIVCWRIQKIIHCRCIEQMTKSNLHLGTLNYCIILFCILSQSAHLFTLLWHYL